MSFRKFALASAALLCGCEGLLVGPHSGQTTNTPGSSTPGTTGTPSQPGQVNEPPRLDVPPQLVEAVDYYFPLETADVAPDRLYRLTRTQLDNTAKTVLAPLSGPQASTLLPRDPLQTNYEYAANLTFNTSNFAPLVTWADGWSALAKANPTAVINCSASDSACLNTKARALLSRTFRGSAAAGIIDSTAAFFVEGVASGGLAQATSELVSFALTSPSFTFRDEVRKDANGMLLPALALQNVTYSLADVPPEALGLNADNPVPAAKMTQDILASAQAREKLARFFSTWLEIKDPAEFTLAPTAYPDFTPQVAAAAVQETTRFLQFQANQPSPSLKAFTQSTQSFVPNTLAPFYDLSPSGNDGTTLVELDPTHRRGLFTHSAFLASHSGPTTTRLVKRGVFFTRKVMCLALGSPPPGTIPTTTLPGNTERERIEGSTGSQAKCMGCHQYINPFGFMLENYDATGRWRTQDEGHPINTSISVAFLDEGPFESIDPIASMTRFTESNRFKQCFVRQLFRYYVGRDELPADIPVLRDMFTSLASSEEQSLLPLLQLLATSDSMNRRKVTP